MYQSWNNITFLHWRYDPAVIQGLIPSVLEVETFDGSAWVSITPFLLENLRAPLLPALPWLSRTPETNVRTYVTGPDGKPGIWFFSLDIARLPAVFVARTAYFLPYMWSRMSIEVSGARLRYRGHRMWPRGGVGYDIEVVRAGRPRGSSLRPLDHFLTARWRLFTLYGSLPGSASVEHEPWRLWGGRVVRVEQTLLAAAGIPDPQDDPVVHFSPGVDTRISSPRLLRKE